MSTTKIQHTGRVAIVCRFHGPTNHRGARIIADAGDGRRCSVSYDHDLPTREDRFAAAALALMAKMSWEGDLLSAPTDDGMVFVMTDPHEEP